MFQIIISFVLGACIGSFVGVIVDRLHVAPILSGRSKCLSCGKHLTWREMFPILSYLAQGGKCRFCGVAYGAEYLLIEVVYGTLFALFYTIFISVREMNSVTVLWSGYYLLLFIVLGVLFLYDIRHKILPKFFLFSFLGLASVMFVIRLYHTYDVLDLLSPFIIAAPAYIIYLITKKQGMGLGDIFLFSGIGMLVGVDHAIVVTLLAVWGGALVGSILLLLKGLSYRKHALPLAPFIISALLFVLFTDTSLVDVLQLGMRFYSLIVH